MSHTDNFNPVSFKFQQIKLLQLGYQPEVTGFPIVKAYARILPQKPIIISYHVWYSLQA
jgi:hypothetical protein